MNENEAPMDSVLVRGLVLDLLRMETCTEHRHLCRCPGSRARMLHELRERFPETVRDAELAHQREGRALKVAAS